MKTSRFFQLLVVVCTTLFALSGCGGGTSQTTTPPPPPAPLLSIVSAVLPAVVQGQTFNFVFQATGGTGTLNWTSLDPLPAGLTLSIGGVLSGIPASSGTFNFRVQVQDSGQPAKTKVSAQSVTVIGTLSVSGVSFPNANRGIGYQFSFFPSGGSSPFNFKVTGGSLPSGMTITANGSNAAQLSGTPTQAGNFAFTVQVTDSGQGSLQQTASAQLLLHVNSILQITTINLPSGVQNRPYTGGYTAVNGTLPLHWSVPFVPQGLIFDATTGVFTGTPTQAVASNFAATVTDSGSPPQTNTASITWFIYGPLQFYQTNLGSVQVGFTGGLFPISYTGGEPPVTSSLISGTLPPGMALDGSANLLDGAATQVGNYSIGVQLQDAASPPQTAQATLTFTITPPLPVLANATFPGGVVGLPYSWGVAAKNGQPPFSWNIRSGSLPPGLMLDSLGLISGTPTTAGTYPFILQVTDSFTPADTSWSSVVIVVTSGARGRNDSIATATPLTNGSFNATISPYFDPSTIAADSDYYKLNANPGSIVSISILAKRLNSFNPLDSVVEIVDGSGTRLSNCKDPVSAFLSAPLVLDPNPNDFNDQCINDDDPNTRTTDSDLYFQVPGNVGGPPVIFYVHVLDWRGNARPDMDYQIQISGAN